MTGGAKKAARRPAWDSSPSGKTATKAGRPVKRPSEDSAPPRTAAASGPAKARDRPWSAASSRTSNSSRQMLDGAAGSAMYKDNGAQDANDRPPSVAARKRTAAESEQLEGLERGWVGNGQPPPRTSSDAEEPVRGFRVQPDAQQKAGPPAGAKEDAGGAALDPVQKAQAALPALEVRAGGTSFAGQEGGMQKGGEPAGKKGRKGGCCCAVM